MVEVRKKPARCSKQPCDKFKDVTTAIKRCDASNNTNKDRKLFCVISADELMAGFEGEINTYNGGNNVWSLCEILTCGVYLGNMKPFRRVDDDFSRIGSVTKATRIGSCDEVKRMIQSHSQHTNSDQMAELMHMMEFNHDSGEQ